MLRTCLSVAAVLVAFAHFPPNVRAQDPGVSPVLSRIRHNGELRVGMTGDQAPFNLTSKSGKIIGMEVDLAELLASSLGVELKLVTIPFPQLLPALRAGEVDMVMSGVTATLDRNLTAAFVGPYFVSGKSILTKSSTLAGAQDSTDLDTADLSFAALGSSTSELFVSRALPKAKLVTTQNYQEAVQMVLKDEVNALVADMPICRLTVLQNPDAGLVTLSSPLTIEPIGIALPPGDSLLVNLVENYLTALRTTGVLEAVTQKWFADSTWLIQVP